MDNIKRRVGRQRTAKSYNMDLCKGLRYTKDFYKMPIIKNDNYIPNELIGFNYIFTRKADKDSAIHFYLDDFLFERIWTNPERYIEVVKKCGCMLSPDFSLYTDMSPALQIYNTYRSRLIGAYFQSKGVKVIPTISWSGVESFDFCFLGIPKGSIVSISTIGVKKNKYKYLLWCNGVKEMIRQIEPSSILIYGGEIDYNFQDTNIIYYKNETTERLKGVHK